MDCIMKIMKEEGPMAFFKGLEATLWRHALWNGGYFGIIHGVREALPEAESPQGQLLKNFIAGSIGGTFGTILNTPFDVVKTRIQNQVIAPGQMAKYNWTIPALSTIAKEEGFGALYKGFTPKVLRLGPGGGILLVVFELVTGFMRKNFLDEN
jgi:solute carrier family 25 2-oxodicarboxylate transporter 21